MIRTLNCWNNGLKNEEIRRGLVLKQKGIRTVDGLLGAFNSTKGARKENGRWLLEKRDASIGSRLYKALPKEGVQAMKERAKIYAKTRKDQGDILNIDTELNSVLPYKDLPYKIPEKPRKDSDGNFEPASIYYPKPRSGPWGWEPRGKPRGWWDWEIEEERLQGIASEPIFDMEVDDE
ncbi:MAG: hypothetical protein ACRCT1_22810 [Microcoleaceae cyanobacterium]